MRYRQIHLDFHTNETIAGIGSRFDPGAFARAFKEAHVDSVTVFSKCHHGHSYHPTEVGKMHPHLEFDLLRAQIDALHAEGINAPIYLTATWDELAAFEHPEWRTVSPDGTLPTFMPQYGNGAGWAFLDFASPYLDYLCHQTEEVMQRYPDADGIFMDISFQLPSISRFAKIKMDAMGLDWSNAEDREAFTAQSIVTYFGRVRDAVHKHNPKMPLYFNSPHMPWELRKHYKDYYSHVELESLPTAGWGYEHFPLSARFVDTLGEPFLGMTGKFHIHWGEVGGYKLPEALVYECGAMLAHGACCSIGDHLHPTGQIDRTSMDVIRPAYKWVAEREAWAKGSTNRAQVAMLPTEAASLPSFAGRPHHHCDADEGASRVLLETQMAFDVVDMHSDLSGYRLLILPDDVVVGDALKAKVEAFVAGGGRVLLTGKSGIDPEHGFVFDVGADWDGTSPNSDGDYVLPTEACRASFVGDPLFMYAPAEHVKLTDGTSLGEVYEPYFNRTVRHFSGHVQAASKPEPLGTAAGSAKGGFTYFAFPIFTTYFQVGSLAMLEIAEKLIEQALGEDRLVTTSLPRAGRVTVRHQPEEARDVVHLLYATPALRGNFRGAPVQPIQELIDLHDITVDLAATGAVKAVSVVPNGPALEFTQTDGRVRFTVPKVRGHQMVEVRY
ncbi:beta-galactosidase trimerization domain-containing protein [Marinovum sp.]|uniref:beta-galactosidase trimerization domain-containing protein n=1 Tax=Marinovum sp. TaxID=2024839 RepID=UPI002B27955F|nr:beta-galactosidase trimerization domain-containing protein [Marinovum sp.]